MAKATKRDMLMSALGHKQTFAVPVEEPSTATIADIGQQTKTADQAA